MYQNYLFYPLIATIMNIISKIATNNALFLENSNILYDGFYDIVWDLIFFITFYETSPI